MTRNGLVFAGQDGRIGDEDMPPDGRIARFISALRPVYGAAHRRCRRT